MPKPPKLLGLSRRPRKQQPLPDPPEGHMWMGSNLMRIEEVSGKCALSMYFYDRLPTHIRKVLQEHGPKVKLRNQ